MIDQNADARIEAIQKSLQSYRDSGNTRTETIEYRGKRINLEVITLLPAVLLLNHDNSRLSAQLVDHPKRALVEADPTSEEAQQVLASLLRSTDLFRNLKEELKVLGQQNPGMVSRDGVLINGNTRLVALRDLGSPGIDVAVLPADALPGDFLDIEMSLQMLALTHQNYTFTNQLLLMDRYLSLGHSPRELAEKLNWLRGWQRKIDQNLRVLNLINEIRGQYQSHFPYEYFDTKQQVLKDLDDDYQRLIQADYESAENLKWTRISAIFLGVSKDQVRAIDENFFDDEVIRRLETKPEIAELFSSQVGTSNPDLDDLLGKSQSSVNMKEFAKSLMNSLAIVDGSVLPDLTEKYQEIATQVKLGADEIIMGQKQMSYLAEPSDLLRETRINLDRISDNFGEISSMKGFKSGDFNYELHKVQRAVADLVSKSKRYLDGK